MNSKRNQFIQKSIAWALTLAMAVSTVLTDGAALTVRADEAQKAAGGAVGIEIKASAGYEEGAYVEWLPLDEADGYQVYVSKDTPGDDSDLGTGDKGDVEDGNDVSTGFASGRWVRIDDELLRYYDDGKGGTYMRADALGLTAGTWYFRIEAATFNSFKEKLQTLATEVVEVTVTSHDRSGFGWEKGTSSGAYNEDGSLKANAKVLYVTEETKDKVSMTVQGAGTCTGLQKIFDGYKLGQETTPLDVRFIGKVTDPAILSSGDLALENGKNGTGGITIEGVGEDATLVGFGISLHKASNVEIRNLGFMLCDSTEGDNVSLNRENDHIWVHHCDFFYGEEGKDSDQKKGDGMLDCKLSNYVTFSYNHFWDSGKSCLLGNNITGEDDTLYITYHHNWFDHSDSRHPRVRSYSAHIYNNYYDGNSKYGVGATQASSLFVENNYFRNSKYPILISMQGSDSGIFSSENGGMIKAYGNEIVGGTFIPYDAAAAPTDFDAYVASTREEKVPAGITTKKGSNSYNNFDTEQENYISKKDYTLDAAGDVPQKVMANAGRLNGGDFQYTFDNATADDSYDVDEVLKGMLKSYQSSVISVGGILSSSEKEYRTVTFDPANGEATKSVLVELNQPVEKPEDPTVMPEGMVQFGGWYNGDTEWDFTDAVTGNMTLTAHYRTEDEAIYHGGTPIGAEPVEHVFASTIKYDTKTLSSKYFAINGSLYDNQSTFADYNNEGSFKGYGLDMKNSSFTFTTLTPKSNIVLILNVGTDEKGVTIDNDTKKSVGRIIETEIGQGEHLIKGKDTCYLYKIYVIPVVEECTITVDKADGSAQETFSWTKGIPVTKEQLPDPVREGYTFTGWVDGDNNEVTVPFAPNGDMTLTATWRDNSAEPDDPNPGPVDPDPGPDEPTSTRFDLNIRKGLFVGEYYAGGFSVMEDMPLYNGSTTPSSKTVGDVTYEYWVQGNTNPTTAAGSSPSGSKIDDDNLPVKGAVLILDALQEGTASFVCANEGKPICIVDVGGTLEKPVVNEIILQLQNQDYAVNKVYEFKVKKDHRYYIYARGSKIMLCAAWVEYEGKVIDPNAPVGPSVPDDVPDSGLYVRLADGDKFTYTGSAIKPAIEVYNNQVLLTEGVDYTVKYKNNVKAGEQGDLKKSPSITVTGKGNLSNSNTTTFTISPKDISDDDVTVAEPLVFALNAKVTPSIYYNGVKLGAKDYSLDQAKFTASGEQRLTITGQGNYTGKMENITVNVVDKKDLLKLAVDVTKVDFTYDGTEKTLTVTEPDGEKAAMNGITVYEKGDKNKILKENEDFTLVYSNCEDAGTVKVTVIGQGLYTGSNVTKSYKINPIKGVESDFKVEAEIDESSVELENNKAGLVYKSTGATFDGLEVYYKDDSTEPLVPGKDYKVTYSGNKKVGVNKAKMKITFLGNYKGSKAVTITFSITAASLSEFDPDDVVAVSPDKVYSKPNTYVSKPYVAIEGVLVKASEYTVEYYSDAEMTEANKITGKNKLSLADDVDSATVYVKITGKANGNYAPASEDDFITTTYEVGKADKTKDLSKARVTFMVNGVKTTKLEYTGNPRTFSEDDEAYDSEKNKLEVKVEIKDGKDWKTLVEGTDYEAPVYVNNENKGKATVVINGKGDYAGGKTAAFSIATKNLKGLEGLFSRE